MIGIIGGYGDIGKEVVGLLYQWGVRSLKVGGRSIGKIEQFYQEQYPEIKLQAVDFRNIQSLHSFMQGCELVINCSGPSHETSYGIAKAAAKMNVHYIDLGMDAGIKELEAADSPTILLYGCGTSQGLSGILQRILLDDFDMPRELEYSFGGISAYTATAAEDFIKGTMRPANQSMVMWDNGLVNCGMPKMDTSDCFNKETQFYPFYDEESAYIVQNYRIQKGIWTFAIEGVHFNHVLKRARFSFQHNPEKTIQDICDASQKDAQMFKEQIKFYLRVVGERQGKEEQKTLSLRADAQNVLSGAVTAAAATAILAGEIRQGVHHLITIDDPGSIYRRLEALTFIRLTKEREEILEEGEI